MTIPYNLLLKPPLGTPRVRGHSLFHFLTSLLVMNEKAGSIVFDYSDTGHINDGVITNAAWSGPSLTFNDTGYILVSDNDSLDPAGDFTVAILLRSDAEPDNGSRIFCKGNVSGAPGNGDRFEVLWAISDDHWEFVLDDNSTKTNVASAAGLSQMYDGKWHLWIFERNFGTTLKIFVDGNTEIGSGADNTGSIVNASNLLIGAAYSAGTTIQDFWTGDIGMWGFWKRKLLGSEKNLLYQEQYWMFKDPSEQAVLGGFVAAAVGNPWNYYAQSA